MRVWFFPAMVAAVLTFDVGAQTPAPTTDPGAEAPNVLYNGMDIFEPLTMERVTVDVGRESSAYVNFLKRYRVVAGSNSPNMSVHFTFSSISVQHDGPRPGTANFTLSMADGRTLFLSFRSLPRRQTDRVVFVR
jgi:hypothetical protein